MDAHEWITRCSARLHRRWPSIPMNELEETAADLHAEERWRAMLPERAAEAWLRLGVMAE